MCACKKNDKVLTVAHYKGDFSILEEVGDTSLVSDTCYSLRRITFKASRDFITFNWKIGNISNTFITPSFDFVFPESDQFDIKLHGLLLNRQDTAISKLLVIYQPRELISPLVGNYLGHNIDNINDTFTISINYWFGERYPWWKDGAYSIRNLPKGYKDSTQNFNGYNRPEIQGIVSATGYKNLAFDKSGNIPAQGIKGYASLHRGISDSLIINYKVLDTQKFNSDNSIIYINKQFIGLKK